MTGHKDALTRLAVSPDGRHILSASRRLSNTDKSLILWETRTGREIRDFHVSYGVDALAITPDGKAIITGSSGSGWDDAHKSMAIWDVATGRELRKFGR